MAAATATAQMICGVAGCANQAVMVHQFRWPGWSKELIELQAPCYQHKCIVTECHMPRVADTTLCVEHTCPKCGMRKRHHRQYCGDWKTHLRGGSPDEFFNIYRCKRTCLCCNAVKMPGCQFCVNHKCLECRSEREDRETLCKKHATRQKQAAQQKPASVKI
jgi:hypothetical protein